MKYKVINKQHNSKSCFVCGIENEIGLKTSFYELENNELVGLCTIRNEHQSYPGRMHGGVSAALLDETIGRAVCIKEPHIWGVTAELNIQYKKPIPLDVPLKIVGRITRDSKRLFEGTGEIYLENGEIAAIGTGKYLKMPLEKISDHPLDEEEWFIINTDNDPDYIEF